MIVCAGRTESFSFAKPIGVGLIESAYNLGALLSSYKPGFLLFVGSCGSYGDIGLLESFYSRSAAQVEGSYLANESDTPLEKEIKNIVSHETIVNSSNYITSNKALSQKFLRAGYGVENMEFYSVLYAARAAGVEAKGFFVTTNYCFEGAREEYRQNLKAATQIIYDRYEKELKEYE